MMARQDPTRWRHFLIGRLPWWIGAAGLLIYLLTLNPSVSFHNVRALARVSGWIWQPQLQQPLTAALLFPVRFLPENWIAPALNVLAACCAALVLVLLARSVALLRHDIAVEPGKKDDQSSLFIGPHAWIPPVLAALVCGLQLSFWEQATNWTGELVDLLVFAWVIRCLLEYRVDRDQRWLYRCGLVFGAGMANDWAMVGYLPVMVAAVLWITSFQILYNRPVLLRLLGCGIAGLSLYFLLPLVALFAGEPNPGFWPTLKANLKLQREALAFLKLPAFRVLALTSLLPLLVISIRWKSHSLQVSDDSRLGVFLTRFTVHFVHTLFFCCALWIALDPTFSPRHLNLGVGMLTYYYMSALVAGYCAGYLLLIGTGKIPRPVARLAMAAVWLSLCALPLLLAWRNLGQIAFSNGPATRAFLAQACADLPAGRSIVVGDETDQLFLLRAETRRHRKEKQPLFVEATSLGSADYHRFMARQFPQRWKGPGATNRLETVGPLRILNLLSRFAAGEPLLGLDAGFGLVMERFDAQPNGLVQRLKPIVSARAANLSPSLPPLPAGEPDKRHEDGAAAGSAEWAAQQEQLWQGRWQQSIEAIAKLKQSGHARRRWWVSGLRLAPYQNRTLSMLARIYAKALNGWGVQLQRLGQWEQSAVWLQRAVALNEENLAAGINLEYNQRRSRGQRLRLEGEWLEKRFHHLSNKYPGWLAVQRYDGPIDEPGLCAKIGRDLFEAKNYRQASRELRRSVELDPDEPGPKPWLALSYLNLGEFERALETLSSFDGSGPGSGSSGDAAILSQVLVCRTAALRALGRTNEAAQCVERFVNDNGRRPDVLALAAELFASNQQLEPALVLLDRLLEQEPNNLSLLTKKGRVESGMARYAAAIKTLSQVTSRAPLHEQARLQLAIARLGAGQIEAAQKEYEELLKTTGETKNTLFGLGGIAWRKKQTNEAIALYQRYLSVGTTGSPQYAVVSQRLRQLTPGVTNAPPP